jgi:hypothetical protein
MKWTTIGTGLAVVCALAAVSAGARIELGNPFWLNTDACDPNQADDDPRVASDGAGNWIAVWSRYGTGDDEIFFATSADDGVTWSAPQVVNTDYTTDGADDWDPDVALDSSGKCVVVWERRGSPQPYGPDPDIFYAASTNGGTTWCTPQPLNPDADTDEETWDGWSDDYDPRIATNNSESWVAVWSNSDLNFTAEFQHSAIMRRHSSDIWVGWGAESPFWEDEGSWGDVTESPTADIAADHKDTWIVCIEVSMT